jgi:hypothetical protein
MFLKNYDSEDFNATHYGCDRKTYRKWMWIVVDALASLNMVSNLHSVLLRYVDNLLFALCSNAEPTRTYTAIHLLFVYDRFSLQTDTWAVPSRMLVWR